MPLVVLTFLTSNRFLPSAPPSAAPPFALLATFLGTTEPEGASVMSTSAILIFLPVCRRISGCGWDVGEAGSCICICSGGVASFVDQRQAGVHYFKAGIRRQFKGEILLCSGSILALKSRGGKASGEATGRSERVAWVKLQAGALGMNVCTVSGRAEGARRLTLAPTRTHSTDSLDFHHPPPQSITSTIRHRTMNRILSIIESTKQTQSRRRYRTTTQPSSSTWPPPP